MSCESSREIFRVHAWLWIKVRMENSDELFLLNTTENKDDEEEDAHEELQVQQVVDDACTFLCPPLSLSTH